jgi:hypothetical protein
LNFFFSLQIPLDLIQCLNSIENITELDNCINTEMEPGYTDSVSEIGSKYVTGTKPAEPHNSETTTGLLKRFHIK